MPIRFPWTSKTEKAEPPVIFAPLAAQNPNFLEQKSLSFISGHDYSGGSSRVVFTKANRRERESCSIVGACCSWAGRNIQKAEIAVFKDGKSGWEKVPNHPAAELIRHPQALLKRSERNKYSGRQLLSSIIISAMVNGDAYVQKVRNASGQIIALDYLPYEQVTPQAKATDSRIVEYYEIAQTKGVVRLAPEDVITFPLFGLDEIYPYKGRDILKSVARQIVTDNKVAQYSDAIMDSPSPRLAISTTDPEQTPNEAEAKHLQQQFVEATGGKKAGKPAILTFPATITPFSFSPDDMAIDTIATLPETRICAIYGIPPTVLQLKSGLEHSTYSNMGEAREAATEEFLVPMWTAIAEVLTEEILMEFKNVGGMEVRFDTSMVAELQEDKDKVWDRALKAFTGNGIPRSEYRQMIGKEPLPGDENTWSWQLKPTGLPVDLPQGPKSANEARSAAESA